MTMVLLALVLAATTLLAAVRLGSAVDDTGCIKLSSYNFPSSFWTGDLTAILPNAKDRFRVVAALDDTSGAVSIESCDIARAYVVVNATTGLIARQVFTDAEAFASHASFFVRPSLWFPGFTAFESTASPSHYIIHNGRQLELAVLDGTQAFRAAGSWNIVAGQDYAPPNAGEVVRLYAWGAPESAITSSGTLSNQDEEPLRVAAGLNKGGHGAISFESTSNPGKYLVVEKRTARAYQVVFRAVDTTFNDPYVAYVTLECAAFPGNFLAQQDRKLTVIVRSDVKDITTFNQAISWLPVDLEDDPGQLPTLPPLTPPAVSSIEQNIKLHYTFDEDQGSVVKDSGSLHLDGSFKSANSVQRVDGIAGRALRFTGADDSYVQFGSFPQDIVADFTVSLWIRPTRQQMLDRVASSGVTGLDQPYVFYPQHGGAIPGANNAGFGISAGTNGVSVYAHDANYLPCLLAHRRSISDWTHVVVRMEASQPSMFINGEFAEIGVKADRVVHVYAAYLGSAPFSHFKSPQYVGDLDELRVYDRKLTDDEIRELYTAERTRDECFFLQSFDAPDARWDVDADDDMTIITSSSSTSTFRAVTGFAGTRTIALESCQREGLFVRANGKKLQLSTKDKSVEFARAASLYSTLANATEPDYFVFAPVSSPSYRVHHRALLSATGDRAPLELVNNGRQPASAMFLRVYPFRSNHGLPCDGSTTYQDEVARFEFEEGSGTETADTSFGRATGLLSGSISWIKGKLGAAVQFNNPSSTAQTPIISIPSYWAVVQRDFTVSFWAKLPSTATVSRPSSSVYAGLEAGRRWLIFPPHGEYGLEDVSTAGFGVSLGANALGVYAHTSNYIPALLYFAFPSKLAGWHHFAIVVRDNTPALFLDGVAVAQGNRAKYTVTVRLDALGSARGVFLGGLDDLRVFDRPLPAREIKAVFEKEDSLSGGGCVVVDEHDAATLTCSGGADNVIADIPFASYGTPTGNTCGDWTPSSCHSDTSRVVVLNECAGKHSCTVHASNTNFGDPCYLTFKRLAIEFTCVNKAQMGDVAVACAQADAGDTATLTCPAGLVVSSIDFASYGRPTGTCGKFQADESCHAPTSESALWDLCPGKQTCTVPTASSFAGFSCSGSQPLQLKAQYTCRSSVLPEASCVTVLEGYSQTITCPANTVIAAIPFASYGTPTTTCGQQELGECHATQTASIVKALCLGQSSCTLASNNGVFSDPCLYTYKHLSVQYICAGVTIDSVDTCKPVSACPPLWEEVVAPTPSSDRECAPCADDGSEYFHVATGMCAPVTHCLDDDQYEAKPPTASSDRVCLSQQACTEGQEFESVPASAATDRVCSKCDVCPDDHREVAPCTLTSDRRCEACGTCDGGQFEEVPCSGTQQTVCRDCTVCTPRQYETSPCQLQSDRQCKDLHTCSRREYETISPTATTDRACARLQVCEDDEFETVPPTATTDRKCQITTSCRPGEVQKLPPTATSDRVCDVCQPGTVGAGTRCVPCNPGTYAPLYATQCFPCEAGTADTDSNPGSPCTPCDGVTTYQPNRGQTACLPVSECPDGTEEASAPTTFSDRRCRRCQAGEEVREKDDPACRPVTDCPAGMVESQAPTSSTDRVCSPCAHDTFKVNAGQTPCRPVTDCAPGEYVISTPTPTSDRQCLPCEDGTFSDARNAHACREQTTCEPGAEYQTKAATPTTDAECERISTCRPNQYIAVNATLTSDVVCELCTVCPSGHTTAQRCGRYSDARCQNCGEECVLGVSYQQRPCTASSSRVCKKCTPCKAGVEYEAQPCTLHNDTLCRPITDCAADGAHFESQPATASSDAVCSSLMQCDADVEFEAVAPTPTSNRKCARISPECTIGSEETAAPTPTSDRVCVPCPAGTSWVDGECESCAPGQAAPSTGNAGACAERACPAGTFSANPTEACTPCPLNSYQNEEGATSCKPATPCSSGEEPVVGVTRFHDRQCSACRPGWFSPGNVTACTAHTVCDAGQTELAPPTTSTDRQCSPCATGTFKAVPGSHTCSMPRTCTAGYEEAAPPTLISNRVCRACDNGVTFKADAGQDTTCIPVRICAAGMQEKYPPSLSTDRECEPCPSGTFNPDGVNVQCRPAAACSAGDYEQVAPTVTSDAVCVDCNSQDGFDDDSDPTTSCKSASTCDPTTEVESVPLTPTSDRSCHRCSSGETFQAGNDTRACVHVPCPNYAVETAPPSATSDRVCTSYIQFVLDEDYDALILGPEDEQRLAHTLRLWLAGVGADVSHIQRIDVTAGSIVMTVVTNSVEVAEEVLYLRCTYPPALLFKGSMHQTLVNCTGANATATPGTQAPASSSGTSTNSIQGWTIAVIAIAVAAIVALVVAVVAWRKRRTRKQDLDLSAHEHQSRVSFENPTYMYAPDDDGTPAHVVGYADPDRHGMEEGTGIYDRVGALGFEEDTMHHRHGHGSEQLPEHEHGYMDVAPAADEPSNDTTI
ncbi:hypothetical protein PTSG_11716 [Salpingoeca rosetta]|uniref:Uncharacterized protein n=1 Tax=Salpingoeca rosetta (strain ATCC 50818 / BSB-021) TaxID=946362 RepID=F2U066_SALR5|nr:uncharacterized protein PTSG_11716 [Salpingoeca rosetta]EGD80794.1 hypothetical protein PTSG_11716 [Salpingoeca rosetta]|eukprot:XP_004997355.1 hypothetical protein PTSG_11716 [Salpingoeca rosetta]